MYLCKRKTYEMKKKNSKIEMDQQTIRLMIDIYCKHHLGTAESPLKYNQLVAYACHLFEHCRWGEKKMPARIAPSAVMYPEKREKIQAITLWICPRMIFYSTRAVLRHLIHCMVKTKTR